MNHSAATPIRNHVRALLLACSLLASGNAGADIIFSDNFNRANVDTSTGSSAIGNGWTFQSDSQSPARGGAQIAGNILQIGQTTAGGYAGAGGADRSWIWQDNSVWPGAFEPIIKNNPELVVWSFNLRTGSTNPTPVSISGGSTVVAVLATAESGSGDWQFGGGATGYIVTYNDSTGTDPIKLIRMQNGVRNEENHTVLISGTVSPFNDLGDQHLSVKVSYDPSNDLWTLYARNDGASFQDPRTGILTELGTATDNTYTSTALSYSGFLGNANNGFNGASDSLTFDNFAVSIQTEVEAPAFSPQPGNVFEPQLVSIATTTTGATIRYTIDGSAPTPTTGTVYTDPVSITGTTTLRAIGYRSGLGDSTVTSGTYSFRVETPVFSPAPGTYADLQNVTISTTTPGATIRFTTDGSDPTSTSGTIYIEPVPVATTTTIRAIAYNGTLADSEVTVGSYNLVAGAPVFSPVAGNYTDVQTVTISSSTPQAEIRYTTDGNDPTSTTGIVYSGPISIESSLTLKAISYRSAFSDSPVTSGAYSLQAGLPLFSPAPGNYGAPQNVTITSNTSGATIRYTTNGSDPTPTTGTIYTGPVTVSASSTLKAIAYKGSLANSAVNSGAYVISSNVATIVDDSFSDLGRDNGTDPADVAWVLSTNVAPDGSSGATTGQFIAERTGSTTTGFNPHFTAVFSPQTLSEGQTLSFSFDAKTAGPAAANNFRFGLFNSGGTTQMTDTLGTSPNITAYNGDVGYSVFAPQHQTGSITLRARSGNAPFPLAAGTNGTTVATGSVTTATSSANFFAAGLSLTKTATGYEFKVTLGVNIFTGTIGTGNTSTFDTMSIFSVAGQNQPVIIDNVLVTVRTPSQAAGPLAEWRELQGLAEDGSQDLLNPSGDGVANILKYALNLAPAAGDLLIPNARPLEDPAGTTLAALTGLPVLVAEQGSPAVFTFLRRKASLNPGISYVVEWSEELGVWAADEGANEVQLDLGGIWERVQVTESAAPPSAGKRFVRLSVTETTPEP